MGDIKLINIVIIYLSTMLSFIYKEICAVQGITASHSLQQHMCGAQAVYLEQFYMATYCIL